MQEFRIFQFHQMNFLISLEMSYHADTHWRVFYICKTTKISHSRVLLDEKFQNPPPPLGDYPSFLSLMLYLLISLPYHNFQFRKTTHVIQGDISWWGSVLANWISEFSSSIGNTHHFLEVAREWRHHHRIKKWFITSHPEWLCVSSLKWAKK